MNFFKSLLIIDIKRLADLNLLKIYIKIDKQSKSIIEDAKFEVKGCPPVIASCCVATEVIKEMSIEKAFNFSPAELLSIHKRLFKDIFDGAGVYRDYNIKKRNGY